MFDFWVNFLILTLTSSPFSGGKTSDTIGSWMRLCQASLLAGQYDLLRPPCNLGMINPATPNFSYRSYGHPVFFFPSSIFIYSHLYSSIFIYDFLEKHIFLCLSCDPAIKSTNPWCSRSRWDDPFFWSRVEDEGCRYAADTSRDHISG